jgi:hypothetical protein
VYPFLSLAGTVVIGFRDHPNVACTLIATAKILFPNQITF